MKWTWMSEVIGFVNELHGFASWVNDMVICIGELHGFATWMNDMDDLYW